MVPSRVASWDPEGFYKEGLGLLQGSCLVTRVITQVTILIVLLGSIRETP